MMRQMIAACSLAGLLTGQALAQEGPAAYWPDTEDEVQIDAYANEPINTYSPSADFRKLGRAVGKLNILTDAGNAPCTAWIASERYIVTNHHCVPGVLDHPKMNATRIVSVDFLAGFVTPGLDEEAESFAVNPEPVETDKELDYTVLEVQGNPSAKYGMLPITDAPVEAGMPFWIIGHPQGKSQHISREGCRADAATPLEGNRLRHTCDTLGGNSGSPIIDSSARQVIGLHNSGNKRVGINFGIPMSMILERSQVLKAAVPDAEGGAQPAPYTFSHFPEMLAVGDELSLVADMPATCTPTFLNLSPTQQVAPLPLDIFQKMEIGAGQVRYQISAGGQYGLVVLPEDEKGTHRIGYLCPQRPFADQTALKDALRRVVGELDAGRMSGALSSGVEYRFGSYTIR